MISFRETLIRDDRTGKLFVRYTPVLDAQRLGVCVTGELQFASWDASVGGGEEEHEAAKSSGRRNALGALRELVGYLQRVDG